MLDSNPYLDQFKAEWYSKHLRALGEPSLMDDVADESYRFLWLRSFHHPVTVRVWRVCDKHLITVNESDGAGGYEPGNVIVNGTRRLDDREWEDFLRLLDHTCFWNAPSREGVTGEDGAEWILEGFKDGRYHLAQQWSPQDGAYREACLYLLKLSGLHIDPASKEVY